MTHVFSSPQHRKHSQGLAPVYVLFFLLAVPAFGQHLALPGLPSLHPYESNSATLHAPPPPTVAVPDADDRLSRQIESALRTMPHHA